MLLSVVSITQLWYSSFSIKLNKTALKDNRTTTEQVSNILANSHTFHCRSLCRHTRSGCSHIQAMHTIEINITKMKLSGDS